ncbi:Clavaminate synthase-like protein [Stereum hirsutum FP-91666 SS1]|uniref:Clavaminate synthase-like protein n=1 Tax=Stereum hirsutum (strain FP-91666) TaxID=721885 RepID=UPI000444A276|nr:Clavaminate synthase-like protein [Stereum hirsutum FP-91666 SS1]EIM85793.1 Clavaminate synthase-like protein [Stereum hirsutum FP-91666 SS1]
MPVKAASALPIIHIAPWLEDHNHKGRLSTSAAIHAACLEYGFFYLDISSYIDPQEPEELARLARQFFSQPLEEKNKISLNREDHARGYARLNENVTNGKPDNHEGIDFYRPVERPDKSKPLWGENQWPDIPGFREKYEAWVEKMKKLGIIVMEAMSFGLGMSREEWADLRAKVDDSFWVMRVIGYPPLPNDHEGYFCGAHRDYGCLTFLWADPTEDALQVFLPQPAAVVDDEINNGMPKAEETLEQGVWVSADPLPGCIVCNIGEMWEIWTNGLYKSTLHRVIHQGMNYRIPFFFEPNFDAVIAPLAAAHRIQDELPGEHHLKKRQKMKTYGPTKYGDFLLRKIGGNFANGGGKGKYDN